MDEVGEDCFLEEVKTLTASKMHISMYLRMANNLVSLKTEYDETLEELKKNPTEELRNKIEKLAEDIVSGQKEFNQLIHPNKSIYVPI